MCNFVIRPIKSYATVDLMGMDTEDQETKVLIKRGESLDVKVVIGQEVAGELEDGKALSIPLSVFVHTFTANPDDIEKVRKEEHKTMGYDPNKKKDSKESK